MKRHQWEQLELPLELPVPPPAREPDLLPETNQHSVLVIPLLPEEDI